MPRNSWSRGGSGSPLSSPATAGARSYQPWPDSGTMTVAPAISVTHRPVCVEIDEELVQFGRSLSGGDGRRLRNPAVGGGIHEVVDGPMHRIGGIGEVCDGAGKHLRMLSPALRAELVRRGLRGWGGPGADLPSRARDRDLSSALVSTWTPKRTPAVQGHGDAAEGHLEETSRQR